MSIRLMKTSNAGIMHIMNDARNIYIIKILYYNILNFKYLFQTLTKGSPYMNYYLPSR